MAFTSAQVDAMTGLCRFKASTIAQSDNTTVGATAWVSTGDTVRTLTTAGGPKYRTSTINSKPGVTMAKATFDLFAIGGGGLALTDFTIIPVYKMAAVNSDCCFLSHNVNNLQIRLNSSNLIAAFNGSDDATGGSGITGTTMTNAMNDAGGDVIVYRRKDRLISFWEGRCAAGALARGHGQWSAGLTTQTFNEVGGLAGNPFYDGTLCELMIFTSALPWSDIANVLDYVKAEYGITPGISPRAIAHPSRSAPKLTQIFKFQNAANVTIPGLPIDPSVSASFTAGDVDTIAHFNAAIASKLPSASAAGYGSLDLEITSPCIPAAAADYNGAAWNTTPRETYTGDSAYCAHLLDLATAARPNIKFGIYLYPAVIDISNFVSSDGQSLLASYAEAAVNADFFDCFTRGSRMADSYAGTNSLISVLLHGQQIQPELYDKNMLASQAMLSAWFSACVQLCRDMQDFWGDGTVREVWPIIWLQQVPGATGATIPAFTGGTYTHASRTITKTGAFASLSIRNNPLFDRIYAGSVLGGVTQAHFQIASKTSNDAVVLAGSGLGAGADGKADITGTSQGVFHTADRLSTILRALRWSGADGAYLGGDGQSAYYSATEWQTWADRTLRPSLYQGGFTGGMRTRIRSRNFR